MNNIIRLQTKKILEWLQDPQNRNVLLVTGARQVGKTTLIQQTLNHYPNKVQINLEADTNILNEIDRTTTFKEFEVYLSSLCKHPPDKKGFVLFIDEAQESSRLGAYLRFMKEEWHHTKVILSGSSMGRIFRGETKVPVGRFQNITVTPFVFEEFLIARECQWGIESIAQYRDDFINHFRVSGLSEYIHEKLLGELNQYLVVGGLPDVVMLDKNNKDYRSLRTDLINAQEDDFVRKSSLAERSQFKAGLAGVANYLGLASKYSHIHEKKHLAEKILNELKAWHLVIEIQQKSRASTSQLLPKRYLYDCGIAQDIREMPFPSIHLRNTKNAALRTQLGGLMENMVLLQLMNEQGHHAHIVGWKKGSTDSSEVDFIWRHENFVIPIECKAALKVHPKHFSSLRTYLELSEAKVGILVSLAPPSILKSKKYTFINLPLYMLSSPFLKNLVAKFY